MTSEIKWQTEEPKGMGEYLEGRSELIDALCNMIVKLKEEGVI